MFKISGLPTHHINAGVQGPFGRITKGRIDLDVEFKLPLTDSDSLLRILKNDLKKHVKTGSSLLDLFNSNSQPINTTNTFNLNETTLQSPLAGSMIEMRWQVKLWDLKAIRSPEKELGVLQNAMMWSIVGFMNSHHTLIPFTFEASLPMSNFNGNPKNNQKKSKTYSKVHGPSTSQDWLMFYPVKSQKLYSRWRFRNGSRVNDCVV